MEKKSSSSDTKHNDETAYKILITRLKNIKKTISLMQNSFFR